MYLGYIDDATLEKRVHATPQPLISEGTTFRRHFRYRDKEKLNGAVKRLKSNCVSHRPTGRGPLPQLAISNHPSSFQPAEHNLDKS